MVNKKQQIATTKRLEKKAAADKLKAGKIQRDKDKASEQKK